MKKETTKFEIGDIIVPLEYAGMPLSMTDIWKVSDKDNGEYGLQGIAQIGKEYYSFDFVEDYYASIDSLLWYWEYQDADDHWGKSDYRATRAEIEKLSNFHNFAPLYALGFRLSQNLKDEK